jgi:tRNA threonylcarbamoyladenosine biosynthesis protein TsaB
VLTLALDTTTRAGSVAVVRGDTMLAAVEGHAASTHGERLPDELARALDLAGVSADAIDLLVVATGPGAFTGLRIGLAAVQGFAMVRGLPVVGVSALDALALAARESTPDAPIAAWMDAQRGEVFAATYAPGSDVDDSLPRVGPVVAPPGALLDEATAPTVFIGDGARRYRAEILASAGAGHRAVDPPAVLALFLARLGLIRAARGDAGPPHALQPLYVRRSDAELERSRRAGDAARR